MCDRLVAGECILDGFVAPSTASELLRLMVDFRHGFVSLDIKLKGRDQTMKKILIVVVTTLGLVVGMGGALGTAEAAKKPSKFKVKAEVRRVPDRFPGQTVLVTG